MKFAVVGGGIAGLSAAWDLAGAGGTEVTVFEPGHLGGKLLTTMFLGRPVDEGADSLITRVPEGVALCQELGLGEEMGAPEAKRAMLFAGGKVRPFPDGLILGAPARLLPLARSRILSFGGIGRASLDLALPRHDVEGDVTRLGPDRLAIWARGRRTPRRTAPRQHPRRLNEKTERSGDRTPDPGCCPRQPQPPARSACDGPRAAQGQ